MRDALDRYFALSAKGSTVRIELMAGLSTFLVLSYIFVVNPAILSQAGMNRTAVLFATIIVSGLSTIAMGLWARLPFVLAPGMEMNAYVAYFAVGTIGLTWRDALGAVFWSGVLFVALSASRLREKIIDAIPPAMKVSLSLSVGIFIALVACRIAGILTFRGVHVSGVGAPVAPSALVLYAGLVTVMVLDRFKVKTAVLISIFVASALSHALELGNAEKAAAVSRDMFASIGELNLGIIARPSALSVILVLFLIDFYGSVAKLIGLTANTSVQENGRVPRLRQALLVDSIGTTVASFAGTSNITVYVESGVGIASGGRTGLTALACGTLMLSCFALAPFLHWIPLVATTGTLVFIAIKLTPDVAALRRFTVADGVAMLLMQVCVVATSALDRAILAGLLVYAIAQGIRREIPNLYALASIVLLLVGAYFQ